MTRFLLICLGGAAGTGARYLVSLAATKLWGTALPLGTLFVNLLGSFLLGFIMNPEIAPALSSNTRLALTVGVLGGFTTYSTFNYDTTAFFRDGAWVQGFLYLSTSVVGCLACGVAGMAASRIVTGK